MTVIISANCGHRGRNLIAASHLLSTLGAKSHTEHLPCGTSWNSHISPRKCRDHYGQPSINEETGVHWTWVACSGSQGCKWPGTENPSDPGTWLWTEEGHWVNRQTNQKPEGNTMGCTLLSGLDSLEDKEEQSILFFQCPRNSLCWVLLSTLGWNLR